MCIVSAVLLNKVVSSLCFSWVPYLVVRIKCMLPRREASGLGLGLAPHSFLYRQIYVVIIRIRVRVRVKYI